MYAQLEFTDNTIKRVNLIGGEEVGIIQSLIDKYPEYFVDLEGRENVPENDIEWYYNTETDTFIHFTELPEFTPEEEPTPSTPEPSQLDRIETALNELAAGSVSTSAVDEAITEGVNDV